MGLSGYYPRFIKGYGQIAKPLTELLKKDKIVWNELANTAFDSSRQSFVQHQCKHYQISQKHLKLKKTNLDMELVLF
mgnify:CR=1 FL=1